MIRTVSHVVDAEAIQWYADFRNGIFVSHRGGVQSLQKVHMRHEYL